MSFTADLKSDSFDHCISTINLYFSKLLLRNIVDNMGVKIVRKMRNAILVEGENGKLTKYCEVVPIKKRQNRQKQAKINQKRKDTSKVEKMAAELPKCKVMVENMSAREIAEAIEKGKRTEKIRKIDEEIRKMPRKLYIDSIVEFELIFCFQQC